MKQYYLCVFNNTVKAWGYINSPIVFFSAITHDGDHFMAL